MRVIDNKCAACGAAFQTSYRGGGMSPHCSACRAEIRKEKARQRARAWREANLERDRENCRGWYARNKSRHRALNQRWIEKNPERSREIKAAWQKQNAERVAEKNARWYRANKEHVAVVKAAWREANKDRIAAVNRLWRLRNPDKTLAADHRRRARKTNAEGHFTRAQFDALCKQLGHRCFYCGKEEKLTVDHIVPLARGGSNWIENVVPACGSCNSRKHTKTAEEFLLVAA